LTTPTDNAQRPQHNVRKLRFLFLSLVVLFAVFSGMTAGALLMVHLDPRNVHPPNTEHLTRLRDQIAQNPDNVKLRELYNELDRENRAYVLARNRRMVTGALLLAGGLIALVVSALLYAHMDPRTPTMPRPAEPPHHGWLTPRWRVVLPVAASSLLVLAAFVIVAVRGGLKFPHATPEPEPTNFTQNWPAFRGPDSLGIAPTGDWAISWNLKTGQNILWTTPIPLSGKSSPVLWGNRIFLTGATPEIQEVYCFDRSTGKLLWTTRIQSPESIAWLKGGEAEMVTVSDFTGCAAPTPATDGSLVFVCFNTNDVAALDFDGNVKWVKNFGKPDSSYGLASSPLLYRDTLIYQCDQGAKPEDNLSALYGIDKESGDVIWRTDRPVNNAWSSPVLARIPQHDQIITVATPWVIGYEPLFGSELWRANLMGIAEIGSSPAYADGIAYVSDDEADLTAISIDGQSDVTKTKVLWSSTEGLPNTASPVCDGKFLVQTDSYGTITCFDAKKGTLLWKKEFRREFWSSPILSGNLAFAIDHKGNAVIFELGPEYKEIGTGSFGEQVESTPALADSIIYVRTERHLVAIARKPAP